MATGPDANAIRQTVMAALSAAAAQGPGAGIDFLKKSQSGALADPMGLNVLGALYMEARRPAEALGAFDAAVKVAPEFADAHCNRGVALQQMGRNREALAAYEIALRQAPQHLLAHFNRGNILKLLGRPGEAVAAYDAVLRLKPDFGEAVVKRGLVQLDREDFTAAIDDFDRALRLDPGDMDARIGKASALMRLHRFDEAEAAIAAILASQPGNTEAGLLEVGMLIERDAYQPALAAVEALIAAGGATPKVLTAKGAVLWKLGRRQEALAAHEAAFKLEPNNEMAREALGYLYLTLGDFERGFEAYEARTRRFDQRQRAAALGTPAWRGEAIAGKRLLVIAEQGLGDTIQFSRYLKILAARGALITAIVQAPLMKVIKTLDAPVAWHDAPLTHGTFDFHVPLLSLPRLIATRVDTVPAEPRYLGAGAEAVAHWRERLGGRGEGAFKIGLAWQGNPANLNDRRRSLPLAKLAPLAAVPGVRLISVQAVNGLDQLEDLPDGMEVESLGRRITDNPDGIAEVAAAIESLDLLVTSDTMTAHLGGALGAAVWVALTHDADWRWLSERTDSPWYPTMRLFRQEREGDWEGVAAAMAAALRERLAGEERVAP